MATDNQIWKDAEQAIIEVLDVVTEYKVLGVNFATDTPANNGWQPCHAFGRADHKPSAAVCVRGIGRGRYRDLGGSGDSLNLWEFATKTGRFRDWREARKHFADKASVKLPNGGEPKRPDDQLEFNQRVSEAVLQIWSELKGGFNLQAILDNGGCQARYPKKAKAEFSQYVVAFPVLNGPGFTHNDPTGWVIANQTGADLTVFQGKGKPQGKAKTVSVGGTVGGLIGNYALNRLLEEKTGGPPVEVVWKVEGLSDLLALHTALAKIDLLGRHVVVTNSGGCLENVKPDWAELLRGKVVYVLHDCDNPGRIGAVRWASALAGMAAEVRCPALPYPVTETHGADARDFLWRDKFSVQDLLNLAAAAAPIKAANSPDLAVLVANAKALSQPPRKVQPGLFDAARGCDGANTEPVFRPAGESAAVTGTDGRASPATLACMDGQAAATIGPIEPPTYMFHDGCLCHCLWRPDGSVVRTHLSNFAAMVVEEVVLDDGTEKATAFKISGSLQDGDQLLPVEVPAEDYSSMEWVTGMWGVRPIINAGRAVKDQVRVAIQTLSGRVPRRTIYTHTGWRMIDGRWHFLHAGGAIGPDGPVSNVSVRLPSALAMYDLPAPPIGDDEIKAIWATLGMLHRLADDRVVFPIYCALWRAVLGNTDLSVALNGYTGSFKSETAALVQQHFGQGMTRLKLPANWGSTANALEAIAHVAKDVLLTIDDFCPPSGSEAARYHAKADQVMRGAGNGSGRQRLRADTTIRPDKPPRCLILTTGEDSPRGQSLRARMFQVDMKKDDVNAGRLTECQDAAAAGRYAQAMAGYIQWLAPQIDQIRAKLKEEIDDERGKAHQGKHARTPTSIAELKVGFAWFLRYAFDAGALHADEVKEYLERCDNALEIAADGQTNDQQDEEPTAKFLRLLASAIASGRAHVASICGKVPSQGFDMADQVINPQGMAWGWWSDHNGWVGAASASGGSGSSAGGGVSFRRRAVDLGSSGVGDTSRGAEGQAGVARLGLVPCGTSHQPDVGAGTGGSGAQARVQEAAEMAEGGVVAEGGAGVDEPDGGCRGRAVAEDVVDVDGDRLLGASRRSGSLGLCDVSSSGIAAGQRRD